MNHIAEGSHQPNFDASYVNLNKSEKFQDAVNDMRLMMWKRYLAGVANNPFMTKKEICNHLGLNVGTINSIQRHYKLQSPFYYKKPKMHRKKKEAKAETIDIQQQVTADWNSKSCKKKPPKDELTAKGDEFYGTFDRIVKSLAQTKIT